jgi:hypothetical protein
VPVIYAIVYLVGDCGAGEIAVRINSVPPLSNLHVIPDFYFSVCEDLYSDPWSVDECRFWNSAPEILMLSGVYRYKGDLANGSEKRGKFDVDVISLWNSQNLDVPVLTIK